VAGKRSRSQGLHLLWFTFVPKIVPGLCPGFLLTRNFIFGMWWRRGELCLFRMKRQPFNNISQSSRSPPYPCNNAALIARLFLRRTRYANGLGRGERTLGLHTKRTFAVCELF